MLKRFLFLGIMSFLLTSCFEITEKITLKNDGSGKMLVQLDMSESKENLKEYMNSGEMNGMKLPEQSQMDAYFVQIENTLESVTGMSNARTTKDFNNFIFTFAADFEDIRSMNLAMNKLTKELSKGMLTIDNQYELVNGKFRRSFGQIISPEEYEKLPMMQRFVLETARLKSILEFSNPIKSLSNENAELSGNTVTLESTLSEIATGNKTVANTVTLAK